MQTVRKEKLGAHWVQYNVSRSNQYVRRIRRKIAKIKELKKYRAVQHIKALDYIANIYANFSMSFLKNS